MTTDDGYINAIFRITPNGTETDENGRPKNKPVVFLMHGITDTAVCWIVHYPNLAPAFQLVRAGYDVWLGNQRGTKYSMHHKTLDPKHDEAYWEFSFTEMGEHDAPAFIDYVR